MKKIITIVIAIFMLMGILVACNNSTDPGETTEPPPQTDGEPANLVSIFKDKQSDFTIVLSDASDENVTIAGMNLQKAIETYGSTQIDMCFESVYLALHNGSLEGPKIVIGELSEDETSQEIFSPLEGFYYAYTIKISGDSLYIIGSSSDATVNAINYLIDTYLYKEISSFELEENMQLNVNPEPPIANLTINGNGIGDYNIVYYDSYYAKQAAYTIQQLFSQMTGRTLPVISDSDSSLEQEHEILIGKTNRNESSAISEKYDRPNVYYDIAEVNGKLVIMAEGFSTLKEMEEKILPDFLASLDKNHDIVGSAVSGDILISDNANNKNEGNMLTRAEGTEVRIMAWNMGGPGTYGKIDLAEKLADTILKNLPDVLGTNEFYDPPSGAYRTTYDTVLREISKYYYEIESDNDFPDDTRLTSFVNSRGPRPQKIFIRKDAGIKVIAAGWRYTESEKDVNYRSYPWAVLETKEGNKFIYTVSHYNDMTSNNVAAIEQLEAVAYAQSQSGCSEPLPTILSGDLWMARGAGAHKYFTDAGYLDAQIKALVNANNNTNHSTFHTYGVLQPTGRAITDFVMYTPGMTPLMFKVITSREAIDSSDHSPLCVDFKF